MSKKDLFEIALKIIALILFVQFLNNLTEVYLLLRHDFSSFILDQNFQGLTKAGLVFSKLILIISSAILWFFSSFLSRISFKEPNDVIISSQLTKNDLLSTSFSSIGLYLFLTSIPLCVTSLIHYFNAQIGMGPPNLVVVLNNFILLTVGLIVFFSSKGFVYLLKKIENAGIKP